MQNSIFFQRLFCLVFACLLTTFAIANNKEVNVTCMIGTPSFPTGAIVTVNDFILESCPGVLSIALYEPGGTVLIEQGDFITLGCDRFNGFDIYIAKVLLNSIEQCEVQFNVTNNGLTQIFCPPNDQSFIPPGACSMVINNLDPLVNNCEPDNLTYSMISATMGSGNGSVSGLVFNEGITIITYNWDNPFTGIGETCTFSLFAIDIEQPTMVCPDNITVNLINGSCINVENIDLGETTDNCDVLPHTYSLTGATNNTGTNEASGDCFNVGITTVTYFLTDIGGNMNNCSFDITVSDDPETCSVSLGNNQTLCPGESYTLNAGNNANSYEWSTGATSQMITVDESDTYSVTITTTGGCEAMDQVDINFVDNEDPVFSCQDIQLILDDDGESIMLVDSMLVTQSSDNCGTVSFEIDQTFFDCNDLGPNTVTLTANDESNNSHTCQITVTVLDNMSPNILNCPENMEVVIMEGTDTYVNLEQSPLSTDNCTVIGYSYELTGATTLMGMDIVAEFFNIGTTTVNIFVSDDSENLGICTFDVSVTLQNDCSFDLGDDLMICPGENVTLDPGIEDATYEWSTGATTPTIIIKNPDTYRLTITDAGGCEAIDEIIISGDTEAPVIIDCPGSFDFVVNESELPFFLIESPIAVTDNCGEDNLTLLYAVTGDSEGQGLLEDIHEFPFMGGNNTVTYTAIDNIDNTSTCNYTIIIGVMTNTNTLASVTPTLQVRPVPANQYLELNYQMGYTGKGTIQIYNNQGQLVQSERRTFGSIEEKHQITIDHLNAGIYILRMITNRGDMLVSKFVKI